MPRNAHGRSLGTPYKPEVYVTPIKPAPATNNTHSGCHCVDVPSAGTFAVQYLIREGERQTRPDAEVKLLQPIKAFL